MRRTALAASMPRYRDNAAQSIDPMIARAVSIPVPTGGWDAISPLSNMPPQNAVQMDNWIPRTGYVEIRRGSSVRTTSVGTGPVESLMVWNGPSSSKMFAAGGTAIYDASSAGSATAVVTGLTNARWNEINFTNNAGSHYLACANGADTPRIYDGTTWANLNFTGPTLTSVIQLMAHHGRLWLVPANSTSAWYSDVGAISGTATEFILGPLMTRGGQIMAMATWTVDTRQTVDDYAVFITSNGTNGQAIVYAGTDPSSTATWSLYGVYEIGPPIGRRCFVNVGGDLAIICIDGILPMSQLLSTDQTAANRITITKNIMNVFLDSARNYRNNFGWQMVKYPLGMLAILNVPITENFQAQQYVMNTLTGAWCRFTGLNANCWAVFNNLPYFGDNNGRVLQWDTGSSDAGVAITATMQTSFNYFGDRNHRKRWTMFRPLVNTNGVGFVPGIGLNTDFSTNASITTPTALGT